jgi:serine/threonine protein kinase
MENGSPFGALATHPADLTPTNRSLIAYDVALGLLYLHRWCVIHRGMKSLNSLLDGRDSAKIWIWPAR